MSVRLCCVSVIGLCYILCILQHFLGGPFFSRTRCITTKNSTTFAGSYGVGLSLSAVRKLSDGFGCPIETYIGNCLRRVDWWRWFYILSYAMCCIGQTKIINLTNVARMKLKNAFYSMLTVVIVTKMKTIVCHRQSRAIDISDNNYIRNSRR